MHETIKWVTHVFSRQDKRFLVQEKVFAVVHAEEHFAKFHYGVSEYGINESIYEHTASLNYGVCNINELHTYIFYIHEADLEKCASTRVFLCLPNQEAEQEFLKHDRARKRREVTQ